MTEQVCGINRELDMSSIELVEYSEDQPIKDYLVATKIANKIAEEKLGEYMLISWYDKDRDFESPQHASECHEDSAIPGYVDYGVFHGATLKIDMEKGRFVFFYLAVDF